MQENNTKEEKSIEEVLRDFAKFRNSKEFQKLVKHKKQCGINIFDAVGMNNQEIKHSKFLKFLLDPKGTHGMGNRFVYKFLKALYNYEAGVEPDENEIKSNKNLLNDMGIFIEDEPKLLFKDATALTEYKNIDIFLESKANKMTLTIENKIFTTNRNEQLSEYYQRVVKEYFGWKNIFVYLTPLGEPPKNPDEYSNKYCLFDYEKILTIVDEMLNEVEIKSKKDTHKLKYLLEDYRYMVNTEVLLKNKDVKDACKNLYDDYPLVVDLLKEYKPDAETIAIRECKRLLDEKIGQGQEIVLLYANEERMDIRFTTKYFREKFNQDERSNGKRPHFSYRICIYDDISIKGSMELFKNREEDWSPLQTALMNFKYLQDKKISGGKIPELYFTIFRHTLLSKDDLNKDDEELRNILKDNFDGYIKRVFEFQNDFIKYIEKKGIIL